MSRAIHEIALDISKNWNRWEYTAAAPYVRAMARLTSLSDSFGHDSAHDIVLRFLVNAASWRGEAARRVKAELKGMLNAKA